MSATARRQRVRRPGRRKQAASRPLPSLWPVLLGLSVVGLLMIVVVNLVAEHQKRLIEKVEREDSIHSAASRPSDGAAQQLPRAPDPN